MHPLAELLNPYVITAKQNGPRVLFTAGVHGDEYEPMLAAVGLADTISEKLKAGSVTIVPLVNPGAYRMGTRFGADGLDLARICPGRVDGSESERAAAQISDLIRNSDYYVDLHTGGKQLEIFPLSGYMLHDSADIIKKQRQMAEAFNLPVIWGTDKSLEGRTLSVARDAGVPAIYVEYGGGESVCKEIINSYVLGCIRLLNQLGMTDEKDRIEPRPKYWVEDYRPGNGHLQTKMPAPSDGLFVPEVCLGDRVSSEQTWGFIHCLEDGSRKEIKSEASGIVLFLRKSARVKKGDSLGGTLPISSPGKITIP